MRKTELLAPAGSRESFLGALSAGADAFYLAGQKFGKLTAIREVTPIQSARGPLRAWLCHCTCGREVIVRQKNLVGKVTRSCGCLRKEKAKNRGKDV